MREYNQTRQKLNTERDGCRHSIHTPSNATQNTVLASPSSTGRREYGVEEGSSPTARTLESRERGTLKSDHVDVRRRSREEAEEEEHSSRSCTKRARIVSEYLDLMADAVDEDEDEDEHDEEMSKFLDDTDEIQDDEDTQSVLPSSIRGGDANHAIRFSPSPRVDQEGIFQGVIYRITNRLRSSPSTSPSYLFRLSITGNAQDYWHNLRAARREGLIDLNSGYHVAFAPKELSTAPIYIDTPLAPQEFVLAIMGAPALPATSTRPATPAIPGLDLVWRHRLDRIKKFQPVEFSEWVSIERFARQTQPRAMRIEPDEDRWLQQPQEQVENTTDQMTEPVTLRIGDFIRVTNQTALGKSYRMYSGDLAMVFDIVDSVDDPRPVLGWIPRFMHPCSSSSTQPKLNITKSSSLRDHRPPQITSSFNLDFALQGATSENPISQEAPSWWPGYAVTEYQGQSIFGNLAVALYNPKPGLGDKTGIQVCPEEQELVRFYPILRSLQQTGFDDGHLLSILILQLKELRLLSSFRIHLPIYFSDCGTFRECTWIGISNETSVFNATVGQRMARLLTDNGDGTKMELLAPVDSVYLRFKTGDHVRFLAGSPYESQRGFVLLQERVFSLHCVLSEDDNQTMFYRRLAGVQTSYQAQDIVQVNVWDVVPDTCDSSFSRAEAPYWERGQAPPLVGQSAGDAQQHVIEGLMANLGIVLGSSDRDELKSHLYALRWDMSDLQAFLATTTNLKTTTEEFVARKHAQYSWQKGRRVVIKGSLTKTTTKEENTLAKKGYFGYVVSVNREDKTCLVTLDASSSAEPLIVPDALIFDEHLQKSFRAIQSDWHNFHLQHPHVKLVTWLQEQDRLATNSSLPPRSVTPPHPISSGSDGPWSVTSAPRHHVWYDRPLPASSLPSSSPNTTAPGQQAPESSREPPLPPEPPKPSAPKVAFRNKEIVSWPTVDWSFLQDNASVFTADMLDWLTIRVAIRPDVPQPKDWIMPGRIGWLVGCTEDKLTALVKFERSSETHAIPFAYLSNGPAVKSTHPVVVIRECTNQSLVGRVGYLLKRDKRIALSSSHCDKQCKQWKDIIRDYLPKQFMTTFHTLALYKPQIPSH